MVIVRRQIIATPQPVVLHIAHAAARSSAHAAQHRGGSTRAKAVSLTTNAGRVRVAIGGHGSGGGNGGAGSGSGPSNGTGTNGTGSAGSGAGGIGNGNGGQPAGEIPCGIPSFVAINSPHMRGRAFAQDIRLEVPFKDGHIEKMALDYPFVYPDEASYPFSDANSAKQPPDDVLFQPPPPDKEAGEPSIVKYVENHSHAGITDLGPCPGDKM
ncbi:MAG: hypothetical protein GIW98_02450 [Candidatus Eremiobacteraeota bacterium]|nr:hypothetical protein [Candidatus Eremiobacteraeota bacterium]